MAVASPRGAPCAAPPLPAVLAATPATQRANVVARAAAKGSATTSGGGSKPPAPQASSKSRQKYTLLGSPFPLRPVFERKTLMKEVVKDKMWTFEQQQGLGFSNVTINTRMTVIRLKSGGLWVHAPIAPTAELIAMVKELGEVEHIVLPTFAIEHKVFFGPFARKFKQAQCWVAPKQWSFPLNLPLSALGLGFGRTVQELDNANKDAVPWVSEVDFNVNTPPGFSDIGPYSEVAFYHKASKTLLVTDCVVYVPKEPLEIVDPELLIDAAAPEPFNPLSKKPADSPEARRLGWSRMCLQVLYFGPEDLKDPSEGFAAVSERLIASPVVSVLVFTKVPRAVTKWIDEVCADWPFKQIIGCHFAGPVKATATEFKAAFAPIYELAGREPRRGGVLGALPGVGKIDGWRYPEGDVKTLNSLNGLLVKAGAVKMEGPVE
ncbi:unnamed protein product [Pedinophyceae sp. YPF-701]|nr:unnamed protein product [Pedinophyceae sp. YPF-701]